MKLFFILITFYISFCSFSQQEKGCEQAQTIVVTHGQRANPLISNGWPNGDSVFVYFQTSTTYQYINGACNTADVQIFCSDSVHIAWSYIDEVSGIEIDTINWYRNDTLLNDELYDFTHYMTGGGCGPNAKAKTTLNVRTPGVYQIKTGKGNQLYYQGLPCIRVIAQEEVNSINETNLTLETIVVYPNPSIDQIFIKHGKINGGSVAIFDINGQQMKTQTLDNLLPETNVNVSDLQAGYYFIQTETDIHCRTTQRIVLTD